MSVLITGPFDATTASTTIPLTLEHLGSRTHEIILKITDGNGDPASTTGIVSGAVTYNGANTFTDFTETCDIATDNAWNPFVSSIRTLKIDSTIAEADRFLTVTLHSWEG